MALPAPLRQVSLRSLILPLLPLPLATVNDRIGATLLDVPPHAPFLDIPPPLQSGSHDDPFTPRERAERRGIGRRRGAWRRHRGHKVEDSGGTFLRDLRAHLNQNAARMLLLLLRLLLQLLLGVEAPTRQLP